MSTQKYQVWQNSLVQCHDVRIITMLQATCVCIVMWVKPAQVLGYTAIIPTFINVF